MGARLTVLIPCKDERRNIRDCVEAARAVADEILVADSGSTDGTLEIVRGLDGCRLIEREFISYPDFKNWAIPQAECEWVLIVDADERVTETLAVEIRGALAGASEDVDGFWIGRRNFFMGREIKHGGWRTDKVFRLIRRDACRYRLCRVHEEIDVDPRRAGKLREKLLHYTYWSYDQYFAKFSRYTRLSAEDKWDRGRRCGTASMLLGPLFQFFHWYVIRRGFLDGMAGLQVCLLQAFFTSFAKQARLWEMEHGLPQPDPQPADSSIPPASGTAPRAA